jgi:hypothetical protein
VFNAYQVTSQPNYPNYVEDRQTTCGSKRFFSLPDQLPYASYDCLQLITACWLELHQLVTCKYQNTTLKSADLTMHRYAFRQPKVQGQEDFLGHYQGLQFKTSGRTEVLYT